MDIDGYFEMYIKNRIKYDRMDHMKNIGLLDVKIIDNSVIKKIFVYIDSVLFNGTMSEYIADNSIDFRFRENKTSTSVGMYFAESYPGKPMIIGFSIAYAFFQNILNNKIVNIDLGVLDDKNKPCLSSIPIEPLMVTMEHEIIHMLMHITENNKYNDIKTVKSGHTKMFKLLVRNIFGHYRITSSYAIGDIKKNTESKDNIDIGDVVKHNVSDTIGYVVSKKKQYLILCSIIDGDYTYKPFLYKDVHKTEIDNKIDVLRLLDRLAPNVKIRFNSMDFTVLKVNNSNIIAKTSTSASTSTTTSTSKTELNSGKSSQIWKIPKMRIFEIVFLD